MAARTPSTARQPDVLLKTYEQYMARYNTILPLFYSDLKFYTGLIFAVIAGTIGLTYHEFSDVMEPLSVWPGIVLIFGGGLAWGLASYGYQGFQINYGAWLRAITTIAKLEADLGLLQPRAQSKVWANETLISPVFLVNEQDSAQDSEAFVHRMMTIGHGKTARGIFRASTWIGGIMVVGGIAVAATAWLHLGG
jgi:hypothetical protein